MRRSDNPYNRSGILPLISEARYLGHFLERFSAYFFFIICFRQP
jgi:hypothetical protein